MGLDGGTIISRNDVLRGQCWDLNKADDSRSTRGGAVRGVHKRRTLDARTSRVTRWSTCALSGAPLASPVVACFLGRLYNKAAVLEWLLARAGRFEEEADVHRYANQLRQAGNDFDHITSIKDVFPLQYEPAAAEQPAVATTANGATDPVLPAPYCCPITSLRCDRYPFVALRPCGHVLSQRALSEVGSGGACPICGKPFAAGEEGDVIPLVPDDEQLQRLRELLPVRRRQGGKGEKKRKKEQQQQQQQDQQPEQQQGQQPEQQREPALDEQHNMTAGAALAAAARGANEKRQRHQVAG